MARSVADLDDEPARGKKTRIVVEDQRPEKRDGVAPAFADAASLERRGQRLVYEEGVLQAELGRPVRCQEEVGRWRCHLRAHARYGRVQPVADRSGHAPALAHREADATSDKK